MWFRDLSPIRRAFAAANRVSPGLFSFNSRGSCPKCKGRGFLEVELSFLDDVRLECTVCGGNRTRHGADSQQVLASVVRTARQRDLDLPPLITTMLRATGPVVPDAFGLPPPPA